MSEGDTGHHGQYFYVATQIACPNRPSGARFVGDRFDSCAANHAKAGMPSPLLSCGLSQNRAETRVSGMGGVFLRLTQRRPSGLSRRYRARVHHRPLDHHAGLAGPPAGTRRQSGGQGDHHRCFAAAVARAPRQRPVVIRREPARVPAWAALTNANSPVPVRRPGGCRWLHHAAARRTAHPAARISAVPSVPVRPP